MAGRLWVGTSGWVYRHWMGLFYPERIRGEELLPFYARHFQTVEINYTYYRLPERSVFEGWRSRVPDGFRFAVKASRYLTHLRRLQEPEEPLTRLLERAGGLGEKLGPVLFQLPPNWEADPGRLEAFLAALQRWPGHRFAFEFRHPSWLTPGVYGALERAGAALCLPVHPEMPLERRLTAGWTYVRFHAGSRGMGFGEEELAPWARRIGEWRRGGAEVWCYFNNDMGGHALRDARTLLRLCGADGSFG